MPVKRRRDANGKTVYIRAAFRPEDYAVPDDVIDTIKSWGHESIEELLDDREGPLKGRYLVVDRYARDGKDWLLLQHVEGEWCIEVEDSNRPLREVAIRACPPERAWDVALAEDAKSGLTVEREGW